MEGISERCFCYQESQLEKYLKASDEILARLGMAFASSAKKKVNGNWVARSKTDHYVDSSGKHSLGTMNTLDGLGTWRVEQRDGCDLQGWDYGAGRWEHFFDKKRRPFQYTGKETTRCRRWIHTNSRYYQDSTVTKMMGQKIDDQRLQRGRGNYQRDSLSSRMLARR